MDDAGVDEAGFFAPGDDFDGEAQGGFGERHEGGDVFGHAEGVGGHGAHLFGREAAQALVEFGQAGQCALLGGLAKLFVFVQPGGKAHHVFDGVDDLQLPVVVGADLQAETVGAEVYRGQHISGDGHMGIQFTFDTGRRAESQYGQVGCGRSGNRVKPLSGMPGGRRISYLAAGSVSLRGGDEYNTAPNQGYLKFQVASSCCSTTNIVN